MNVLKNIKKSLLRLIIAGLALTSSAFAMPAFSAEVTAEDMHLIEAAGCPELLREYKNYSAAERATTEEVHRAGNETAGTNVVGAATLATFGLGFFTWDNNLDADENLAELKAYRIAIGNQAKAKGCH